MVEAEQGNMRKTSLIANERQQELIKGIQGLESDEGHLRVRAHVRAGRREAAEKALQRQRELHERYHNRASLQCFQTAQQAYQRELNNVAQQERIDQNMLQEIQTLKATWQKELDALRNTPIEQRGNETNHEKQK